MYSVGGVCRSCRAKALRHALAPNAAGYSLRNYSVSIAPTRFSYPSLISQVSKRRLLGVTATPFLSSQIRFASSQSNEDGSPTSTLLPDAPSSQSNSSELLKDSWESSTLTELATAPISTSELGFLAAYGLDFGWGPSSCIQWLFEHVHVYAGTPMWASIILTGLCFRLGMIPTSVMSSDAAARMRTVVDQTKPLQERMKVASSKSDMLEVSRIRGELSKVYRANNIKMWKMFLPFLQIPLGFGMWRVLRNMADVPVPGLTDGGILWFTNLCNPDPLYLLPLATAAVQHLTARVAQKSNTGSPNPQMQWLLLYGLPVLSTFVIAFQPAAIGLSFFTTGAVAFLTNALMINPTFRKLVKMAPLHKPPPPGGTPPYTGSINISPSARDHPHNVRMARENAAEAAKNIPLADKLKPAYFRGRVQSLTKSLSDSVNDLAPTAGASARASVDKASKAKATSFEKQRSKEIKAAREEYEREKRTQMRM